MLKEQSYTLKHFNIILDFLLCFLAFPISYYLRNAFFAQYVFPSVMSNRADTTSHWFLYILFPIVAVTFLALNHYYVYFMAIKSHRRLWVLTLSVFEATFAIMILSFLLSARFSINRINEASVFATFSRGVLLLQPIVTMILLSIKDILLHSYLRRMKSKGRYAQSVFIVGNDRSIDAIVKLTREHPFVKINVVGICNTDNTPFDIICERIDDINNVVNYIEKHPVDEVLFAVDNIPASSLTNIFEQLEIMGIRSQLFLDFYKNTIGSCYFTTENNYAPSITYSPTGEAKFGIVLKYIIDRILALLLLLVFSPVFLLLYLLIKLTSDSIKDPAFYGQKRCGKNGELFTLWKFRSMTINADAQKKDLLSHNIMEGPTFKMKDDPRITPLGKFLRKVSLDELPQIWNVFIGNMSFVGPRPPLPEEVAKYDRWQRRRLSMKPGITCLWQVMGRNKLSFETWMKLDLQYIDNWSLWLDFKIMIRTVYVVLTGYGAM
ncbi:MAG: sugar transferase [Candidatus Sumerlaeales bacterium]|nr:sugar transferase [Candidatus Sumerlaeales bacterium]